MKLCWMIPFMAIPFLIHTSHDNASSPDTTSSDSICDQALTYHFPAQYRTESFYLRPYLQQVISEEQRDPLNAPREFEPVINSPMQERLLKAAHQAVMEKMKEIDTKNAELRRLERRAEHRLTKKQAALLSAVTGLLTTATTLLVSMFSR